MVNVSSKIGKDTNPETKIEGPDFAAAANRLAQEELFSLADVAAKFIPRSRGKKVHSASLDVYHPLPFA